MDQMLYSNSEVFTWVVIPILIFTARIFDVTFGTIRIILVSRGNKYIAPVLGFFEVFIWIIAIGQIMQRLNHIIYYIAYALGFAAGNFVGIFIEEKLAMGIVGMQIITTKRACRLKEQLVAAGYGVTSVDAQGANGQVNMIYTIIKKKDLNSLIEIVNKCDSGVFYVIEDVRMTNKDVLTHTGTSEKPHHLSLFKLHRLFGSRDSKK